MSDAVAPGPRSNVAARPVVNGNNWRASLKAMSEMGRGKLVVVTGGAAGIGEGIVRRLADAGYAVLFCDKDVGKGKDLEEELNGSGQPVQFAPADVSQLEDVNRLASIVKSAATPLYAIVNNAGIFPRSSFPETTLDEWNRVIATNLTGPFIVSRALVPFLIEAGDGVIVNVASGLAFRGDPLGVHYSASKHGIRGLTKSLALALGRHGIRVNAVTPGMTETAQATQVRTREEIHERGRQLPLGRAGQPQDVAGVVAFLLGPDAGYMTGQTLLVNGGADMP